MFTQLQASCLVSVQVAFVSQEMFFSSKTNLRSLYIHERTQETEQYYFSPVARRAGVMAMLLGWIALVLLASDSRAEGAFFSPIHFLNSLLLCFCFLRSLIVVRSGIFWNQVFALKM